jgi:lipopolysaccharide biosynthesis glycosyltransferase
MPGVTSAADIAFTFDAAYAPHVHALVESLLHNHPAREIRLWFVPARDVSEDTRRRIARQVGTRGRVHFLENRDPKIEELPTSTDPEFTYVSTAAYLRLYIPQLLPAHVERVLYLDCDVMCVGSLDSLLDVDLRGNTIAAVRDPYARRLCDMEGMPGLAKYQELDAQAPYFNSGMMLIDVPNWLSTDVTQRCFDYIRRHAAETRFLEQDALNYVLYGKWLRVNKMWNFARSSRLESAMGSNLEEARLIHQIGPRKLWDESFPSGDRKSRYDAYAGKAQAAIEASSGLT